MQTTNVDVYLASTSDHDCEQLAGHLSCEDIQRLSQLSNPRRRKQFILGRRLLKEALHIQYGAISEGWCLDKSSPKLRLLGGGAPEISLSHSREWVACAIGPVKIGLDVEYCRERDFVHLAEQICSAEDLHRFLMLPASERNTHFYRMWTLMEATFKLDGMDVPNTEAEAFPGAMDSGVRHEFFEPEKGYLAALAARSDWPIRLMLHPRILVSAYIPPSPRNGEQDV